MSTANHPIKIIDGEVKKYNIKPQKKAFYTAKIPLKTPTEVP
ncbi:conserved hypothetical protein [Treponema phagedenis]|uniref:Uncharacterized protein n=1 Tax=Treponema phagedenis TaxID=162 RepID=A0A0B7GTW2_TREPH|nr:hypothetical protein HMPREF9554_01726 [Treponema phagedenis F0421]CEM60962.1 conserved hypothetical protein [Treponema phagedenis]